MSKIRQIFITGLLTIMPLVATVYIVYLLFSLMDSFIGEVLRYFVGYYIPGIGMVISIILIFVAGFIATNVLGSKILDFFEALLNKIPVVKKVYFGIKQILNAFSLQGKQLFRKVALIEYPRREVYAIGFVTGESRGEVQDKTNEKMINVFLPTTPNPTSGFLLLVPEKDVTYLDMTVEEALKLIISAGIVVPEDQENKCQ